MDRSYGTCAPRLMYSACDSTARRTYTSHANCVVYGSKYNVAPDLMRGATRRGYIAYTMLQDVCTNVRMPLLNHA